MRRRTFGMLSLAALAGMSGLSGCQSVKAMGRRIHRSATFTLWQLPAQTPSQMLSCVIRTAHGRLIVIDGGTAGDTPYLRGFLGGLGNEVDAWFITHAHSDHIEALGELLKAPGGLKIKTVYSSTPADEWVKQNTGPDEQKIFFDFMRALQASGVPQSELTLGQRLEFDGVRITVLSVKNPEITANSFNNQCVVLRAEDAVKSVIFLGDLGPEPGEKMLHGPYAALLPADYVQMAHHGQNGVNRDVYAAIGARDALWPTPLWLWENDKGEGRGSGPWKTLTVRGWMDELKIEKNYVMKDGLAKIE